MAGLTAASVLARSPRVEASTPTADLVLTNGKIITMDALESTSQAIAVKSGRILAVGTREQVERYRGYHTNYIDLRGKTVTPGLIDAHAHLPPFGQRENGWLVNLQQAENKEAILEKLLQRVRETPRRTWVSAWGVGSTSLSYLNKDELDRVSKDHPLIVVHTGGQWGYANTLALNIAGINKDTPDPPGSRIDRSSFTGEPSGLLIHYPALYLVRRHAPVPDDRQSREAILFAARLYAAEGVTAVHDNFFTAGAPHFIRAYFEVCQSGRMPVRIKIWPYMPNLEWTRRIYNGLFANPGAGLKQAVFRDMILYKEESPELFHSLWGGLKFAADGGGPTALWYNNAHRLPMHKKTELEEMIKFVHKAGHQVSVHTAGDMAVDWTLDSFEAAFKEHPRQDCRHRIEHAWSPEPSSLERMKALGIVVSTHPQWLYGWGGNNPAWVAKREASGRMMVPLRSYLRQGIPLAMGADPPAYPYYQPQLALWQATERITKAGYLFDRSESIKIQEALRVQTMGSAYAAFQEKEIGSLEKGKMADMVIWDQDFYSLPAQKIREVKPEATFLGGKIVYQSKTSNLAGL